MEKKAKLCHMDTDSFLVYIKAEDIYKNNANQVATRKPLSKEKI